MWSWAQEEIWKISSNMPKPPGKTMKTSTWLNIVFIRSDIVKTCNSSPIVFPMMSPFAKALRMTSKTWLSPKNTAIHTPLINPRLPPPYTKWIFRLASTWPRWFADSKNSISFPRLDPPKYFLFDDLRNLSFLHTSICVECMGWVEIKGRKRRFYIWEIENAIIPPICRSVGVFLSLSLSLCFFFWKHVYVQVVMIVAHIFLWFYVQERLKRPQWVEDKLPIQFS